MMFFGVALSQRGSPQTSNFRKKHPAVGFSFFAKVFSQAFPHASEFAKVLCAEVGGTLVHCAPGVILLRSAFCPFSVTFPSWEEGARNPRVALSLLGFLHLHVLPKWSLFSLVRSELNFCHCLFEKRFATNFTVSELCSSTSCCSGCDYFVKIVNLLVCWRTWPRLLDNVRLIDPLHRWRGESTRSCPPSR